MSDKKTDEIILDEKNVNDVDSDLTVQNDMQDDEVIQASQRVMRIKVFATIAAMIVLIFFAVLFWDGDDGYYISIPTDEAQTWSYEISDTAVLENIDTKQESGKFKCFFSGLKEGSTEIIMYRVNSSDQNTVLEKRVYHVSVFEDKSVMQNSVEREVYED